MSGYKPMFIPCRSVPVVVLLMLSLCVPADAAQLRVVITWDHDYPIQLGVEDRRWQPAVTSDSIRTDACDKVNNRIADSTITGSPQVGRGPIEFLLDPVPANVHLLFFARVSYCVEDNWDYYQNPLPRPPANVTVRAYEDGDLIYDGTVVAEHTNVGAGSYVGTKIIYQYRLSPWIDFDFPPYGGGIDWDRMIIATHRPDVPAVLYPSPWQVETPEGERPRFRISGRVLSRRGALPNTPLFLRVTDPPDLSDYIVNAGLSMRNDNSDPEKRGRLEGSDGAVAADGAILPAMTDADGQFSVDLRGTARYGGDNYAVEGSADQSFSCETRLPYGCDRTEVITAWKRAFIEHSYMFKRSAFIKVPQDPAKKTLRVASSGSELCVGCMARLIHTPRNSGSEFYSEDAKITALKKDNKSGDYTVTLDRALMRKFGPAPMQPGNVPAPTHWADAIGIIDATQFPNGDYFFSTNTNYLNQVYPAAFVEYIQLPDRIVPRALIPHVPVFAADVSANNDPAIDAWISDFSARWFLNAGRPNHQHFVAADRNVEDKNFGRAVSTLGLGLAHVFMGKVTGSFGLSAADWRLAGEIGVHELAHNWHVNWDVEPKAHCNGVMFNNTSRTCTMFAALDYNVHGQCPDTVCSEYSDGVVGFHFERDTGQSEYMYIRKRREPMPFDASTEP